MLACLKTAQGMLATFAALAIVATWQLGLSRLTFSPSWRS